MLYLHTYLLPLLLLLLLLTPLKQPPLLLLLSLLLLLQLLLSLLTLLLYYQLLLLLLPPPFQPLLLLLYHHYYHLLLLLLLLLPITTNITIFLLWRYFSCLSFSQERFPDEWSRRSVDKLAYRYPRGESYLDVIARLEPIIIEMERHHEPVWKGRRSIPLLLRILVVTFVFRCPAADYRPSRNLAYHIRLLQGPHQIGGSIFVHSIEQRRGTCSRRIRLQGKGNLAKLVILSKILCYYRSS